MVALPRSAAQPKPQPKVGRPAKCPLETAVPMFEQGMKDGPIAEQLGESRQTISAIHQEWRKERAVEI